jgi:hypothetical protein
MNTINITVGSLDEVYAAIAQHGDAGNEWDMTPTTETKDDPTFLYSILCADGATLKFYAETAEQAKAIYEATF